MRKSVLNHVGHVGLVGHSRGSNSWVILVGHYRGSLSQVKLVGQTRWSFLVIHCHWSFLCLTLLGSVLNYVGHVGLVVIFVGQTRGSFSWSKLVGHSWSSIALVILVPQAPGYSEIPKLPDNFSQTLNTGNFQRHFQYLQFVIWISLFPIFQTFSFFFRDSGILPTLKTEN